VKHIVILGSTGSIGQSTLDIVSRFPDRFTILGLTAGTNYEKLEQQIRTFHPRVVALSSETAAQHLRARLPNHPVEILSGEKGLCTVASSPDSDLVISAIVGGSGLMPTMAAIRAGRAVALANKEPMVMAGELMQEEAHKQGKRIFPIDSEHSAVFQSLEGHRKQDVRRIMLTASGGLSKP
jgi:1-deoxy-D-xylulose-5-phosphate reductoisomerase